MTHSILNVLERVAEVGAAVLAVTWIAVPLFCWIKGLFSRREQSDKPAVMVMLSVFFVWVGSVAILLTAAFIGAVVEGAVKMFHGH